MFEETIDNDDEKAGMGPVASGHFRTLEKVVGSEGSRSETTEGCLGRTGEGTGLRFTVLTSMWQVDLTDTLMGS